jgi:lipopolysaccharide biosynthesis glycosyltransferase
MDKIAVYAGTKNVYEQMYVSLKSLLVHTPMDMVYLLIDEDEFPYPLPENVTVINISDQQYFIPGSPNFNNPWTYMAMMKCALGMLLPDEVKRVLWLDVDTIVDEDISDLFSIDMNGYYYAGVIEPAKSKDIFRYVNVGVLMCNLELLRAMCKEQEMVAFMNVCKFRWVDQEVINLLCQGRIRIIDSIYNANGFTIGCLRPKVIHYAARTDYMNDWAYKKYEELEMPGLKNDGK